MAEIKASPLMYDSHLASFYYRLFEGLMKCKFYILRRLIHVRLTNQMVLYSCTVAVVQVVRGLGTLYDIRYIPSVVIATNDMKLGMQLVLLPNLIVHILG